MNHTAQNSLKSSAFLLGITVEELIDVLHNATQIKEIRTASGCPFILPTREGTEKPAPEVHIFDYQRRRDDIDGFATPDFTNADECKRAVTRLVHGLAYWQVEATYWHDKWLNNLPK